MNLNIPVSSVADQLLFTSITVSADNEKHKEKHD